MTMKTNEPHTEVPIMLTSARARQTRREVPPPVLLTMWQSAAIPNANATGTKMCQVRQREPNAS